MSVNSLTEIIANEPLALDVQTSVEAGVGQSHIHLAGSTVKDVVQNALDAAASQPHGEGEWKLLERYEDGRVHLYHPAEDIGERNDLAAKHPQRAGAMREKLHAWYKQVNAKFLRPKKNLPNEPKPWRPSDRSQEK